MKKKILAVLITGIFLAPQAFADPVPTTGEKGLNDTPSGAISCNFESGRRNKSYVIEKDDKQDSEGTSSGAN
jgi:hypothetical protein